MNRWLKAALCLSQWWTAMPARADDIWDRRDPRSAHLFQDNRARAVGDLLTVAIDELTANNEREERKLAKDTAIGNILNFKGQSSAGGTSRDGSLDSSFSNKSNRAFNGSSQLATDRRFVDKMTVTVVDILPNGNLVIEGTRTRVVAGEARVLRLTGTVRPADIGAANTVQSQFVANFKINYLGRGPQSSFVNQGYWGRAMNLLWPF